MSYTVLYVCTGNICRSPMAELLTRAWADPGAGLVVASAGMHALVGHRIDGGSASALGQLGIDPSKHRARQFEEHMAREADLVLTAERAHRDQIMTEVPSVFKRVFTMKEFAVLAGYAHSVGPGVVAEAYASRPERGPAPQEDDDLADPYRQQTHHAKSIAEEITDSVHVILDALGFGSPELAARGV